MNATRMMRVWKSISVLAQAENALPDLRFACLACSNALEAVGVGFSLMPHSPGLPEPAIATSHTAEVLDELQYTVGQGPGVDAARTDRPVLVPDLGSTSSRNRWPAYSDSVGENGAAAAFALPVSAGAVRVGVLTVYRGHAGNLGRSMLADAFAYADAVLVLALNTRGGLPPSTDGKEPSELTEHRAEIHQAAGMVSAQLDIVVTEALVRLRAYAYAHDQRLTDVAHAVLNRQLRFAGEGIDADPGAEPSRHDSTRRDAHEDQEREEEG